MPDAGDLIGPYRLVAPLGKGAMGEVWRARDERLDRDVALKVLPADAAADLEYRARMLREAKAAAAIRHANVVTLFDIVTHEGTDLLVMELVEGRTLSETLRKDGAPPLATGLAWIAGVTDALVMAHSRGILHRDIKAANIMVTPEGGVKVLDFGLAKLRDEVVAHSLAPPDGPSKPPPSSPDPIALDATMPSEPRPPNVSGEISLAATASPASARSPRASSRPSELESYQTHAGSLLGTPLYMAPEQVTGSAPDERSEVFSVGVLAFEILTGKSPYTATTMDTLFQQILGQPTPAMPGVPEEVTAIVERALDKDAAKRWPTMAAFHDAIAAERTRRFAPRARKWPLAVAAALLVVGGALGLYLWRANRAGPTRPGDEHVARALAEYDVFYTDKALSSLRAGLAVAPDHPRLAAYLVLFGGASDLDRSTAITTAKRVRDATPPTSKDRALLEAALALAERGPAAARDSLASSGATSDRELAFWAAELDYRAGRYEAARAGYRALLDDPTQKFRGRIYDHYSAVLLYLDDPVEALRIGTLYRDAFKGEADAIGVYATTLAAAGKYDEAVAAAEEAVRLSEGEDTLAGLAKVLALKGDRVRAKELYRRSLDRAGPARRPVRRAALALLRWIDGDVDGARAIVAPCLAGDDDSARERGACLFVAGVVDPAKTEAAAAELDELAAAATPVQPAYGAPAALAQLLRVRARFFGGACLVESRPDAAVAPPPSSYDVPLDFYAAYHVPFFATWAVCEKAAALAAGGDRAGAAKLLEPVATRAPGRSWLLDDLAKLR